MMSDKERGMGVVEDSRKLVQDFLAPELRSIAVRLDALEKRYDSVDHKIDQVDSRVEKRHAEAMGRMDQVDRRAERRSAELFSHFDKRHDEVMAAIANVSDIGDHRERMARLEARERPHQ